MVADFNGTSGTRALPETTQGDKRLNGTCRTRALPEIARLGVKRLNGGSELVPFAKSARNVFSECCGAKEFRAAPHTGTTGDVPR